MNHQAPNWEVDWLNVVGDDEEFRLISRWTAVALRLAGPDFDRTYYVNRSTITVQDGPAEVPLVTFTGSADAWGSYLIEVPRPPNHHILAMQRRRDDFFIDGREALLQNLRVLTRILDLLRSVVAGRHEGAA